MIFPFLADKQEIEKEEDWGPKATLRDTSSDVLSPTRPHLPIYLPETASLAGDQTLKM